MFQEKIFPLIALITMAGLVACGGGEAPEAPAPADEPAATAEPAGNPPDLSQAGSVMGKVSFSGTPPKMPRIRMGAEPDCEAKHSGPITSQEVVVNDNGTLKWAFVWVKSGLEEYSFPTPSEPAVLDQDGCVYIPHVFGVQRGQEIKITNSDPATHNIHPVPTQNREWNISQSSGQELTQSFSRPEIMIPVKCNIHPWMKAHIGVVSHPYFAVTGDDGGFELPNLPPGEYTIEVWHEKFGVQEQTITIEPNGSQEIEFSFSG